MDIKFLESLVVFEYALLWMPMLWLSDHKIQGILSNHVLFFGLVKQIMVGSVDTDVLYDIIPLYIKKSRKPLYCFQWLFFLFNLNIFGYFIMKILKFW